MSEARHFADEMAKLAFAIKAPPVLVSAAGKTTQGVVSKPLTMSKIPEIKTPQVAAVKSVPSMKGFGTNIDPARKNSPPPSIYGGTNVQ